MKSKIKHVLIGFGYCIFYTCWFAAAMLIFIASFWTTPGWLAILAFVAASSSFYFITNDFMKIGSAIMAAKQEETDKRYKGPKFTRRIKREFTKFTSSVEGEEK